MSLASFAPPSKQPRDGLLLGDRVSWTHRAAVVRHTSKDGRSEWFPVEGTERGWRPMILADRQEPGLFGLYSDPWWSRPCPRSTPNKSVVVWPEDGTGILFGYVRRGIGRSWGLSGGHGGMFEDDYEPGGFAPTAYVPLYAVKVLLTGVKYMLAPTWATTPES